MNDISQHIEAAHQLYHQLNLLLENLPDDLNYPQRRLPTEPSLEQTQFPCDINTQNDSFVSSFNDDLNDVTKRSPLYFLYYKPEESGVQFADPSQEEVSLDFSNTGSRPSQNLDMKQWSWFRDRALANSSVTTARKLVKQVKDEDKQRDLAILREIENSAKMDYFPDPTFKIIDDAYFRPQKKE